MAQEVEREALIRVARAAAQHADDEAPDHQQTWRDLHGALAALPDGLLDEPSPTDKKANTDGR